MAEKKSPKTSGKSPSRGASATDKAKGPLPRFQHKQRIGALAFAPDGEILASGSDDTTVRTLDPKTGRDRGLLIDCRWRVVSLVFSPKGSTVAAVSQGIRGDNKERACVYLYSFSHRETREIDIGKSPFLCPAFSPDSKVLAVRGDESVNLYEDSSGEPFRAIPTGTKGDALAFTPDGKQLVSGYYTGDLQVYDVFRDKKPWKLAGHRNWISCLTFSPNGELLASAGSAHRKEWHELHPDRTILVWDFGARRALHRMEGDWETTDYLDFLDDGKRLVSFHDAGTDAATFHLWTLGQKKPRVWRPKGNVQSLAVSRDGKWIATGDRVGGIRVHDLAATLAQV